MPESNCKLVRKIQRELNLRPDRCRECQNPVSLWDNICPTCGAGGPVRIPHWLGYLLVGLMVHNLIQIVI